MLLSLQAAGYYLFPVVAVPAIRVPFLRLYVLLYNMAVCADHD